MSTITADLAANIVPGQTVKMGRYVGTVLTSGKAPRSPKWSLILDVGGQKIDFRLAADDAVTIVPADAAPTARAEDHRPVDTYGTPGSKGTACTCGWAPTGKQARVSTWHVAYNRHMASLGLAGL